MKKIFISYSHRDEKWKNNLVKHLKALEMEGFLRTWHDRDIPGGSDWEKEIEQALLEVEAAVLLVSADFLASEFIMKKEAPVLLRRREAGGIKIFPLLVHDCPWRHIEWLEKMQVTPRDGRPLAAFRKAKRETVLAAFAGEIMEAVSPGPGKAPGAASRRDAPGTRGTASSPGGGRGREETGAAKAAAGDTGSNRETDGKTGKEKSWKKWAAKAAFIVAVLTILTLVLDLPGKVKVFYRGIFGQEKPEKVQVQQVETCSLKGMVLDGDGMPSAGAKVRVYAWKDDRKGDRYVKLGIPVEIEIR